MEIKFLSPENLYLLAPASLFIIMGLAAHFVLRKRFDLFLKRSRAKLFSRLHSPVASAVKFSLLGLALICLILTLSRPVMTRPNYHQNFMVLMDLSRSMSVEDYRLDSKPVSRLKMTQIALEKLVEELPPEARFGLATFVGLGFRPNNINLIRILPQVVGSSRKELKQLIDWVNWSQASTNGTPIQLAIANFIGEFREKSEIFGDNLIVILITDGEENIGPPKYVRPDVYYFNRDGIRPVAEEINSRIYLSTELFKDLKLKFVVVGIGTSSGGPIPKFDENWNFVGYEKDYSSGQLQVSRRDDVFLTELAQKLGAEYIKIDGPDDLKILASDPKYKTAISEVQKDFSIYTILAALIFFLAALVL